MNITDSILATLAYFDVFQHPLLLQEVVDFLPVSSNAKDVEKTLMALVLTEQIYEHDGYFSLLNDPAYLKNRIYFESNADKSIPNAIKYGNLIRKFPFVKAVMISGSLSKHVMKKDDDIDFFIVSQKERIWLCKTFLKLYKVFFLKNSYDYFCINYFISESNLFIKEQNQYTATELCTLIPLGNKAVHEKLLKTNVWTKEYLPNFKSNRTINVDDSIKKYKFAQIIENLLLGKIGLGLDVLLMNFNKLRNSVKYREIKNEKDYKERLRSTKEQIKVHADSQQTNTLKELEKRKKSLATREAK